jgi:lipoyl(octanoyl) transferase
LGSRITLLRPGVVAYDDALALQHRLADDVRAGGGETLILLEHPPTYTFGVRGKREHLLTSADALSARGATVVQTDRGGDVTFHGPGQIVGYPILDLRARGLGPAAYVRALEQTIIEALSAFEIDAARVGGRPGVWAGDAKIAALGVRVSRGVTTHGFALNVNTDLAWFSHIVPCGIADATVTSMQAIVGRPVEMREVEQALAEAFARMFETDIEDKPTIAPFDSTAVPSAFAQTALPFSTQSEREQGGEVLVGR